ncbi:MAG TPA: DUF6454 family protein [Streptomyces sp.]
MELTVNEAITRLSRSTQWQTVDRVPLDFVCHHPQGLESVGDTFFLSSVEILEETRPLDPSDGGPDRTAGQGRGHLYELTRTGGLLRHWDLGEGTVYHASGLTFDGAGLWIPVAEYRPHSRSIMYRVNPRDGALSEEFRYPDHLGGVSYDPGSGNLHAITWGGRRVLVLEQDGTLIRETPVNSHFIDFQDCVQVHDGLVSWTGVAEYPLPSGGTFGLGGVSVLNMTTGDIVFEAPVTALSPTGRVVTFNATDFEVDGDVLRMYALPDDSSRPGDVSLLVLEARL